jgi:GNAT superfamily N-acetyltransferase
MNKQPDELRFALFQPSDQEEVKALILAGLVDHWGVLDASKNPDLNDIASTYAGAYFLVARLEGRVVGTGALVPRGAGEAEIVRMSVARDLRRCGVGRALLARLIEQAGRLGVRRIFLETTDTWSEVIAFYQSNGFNITHYQGGDVYFEFLVGA